MNRLSRWEVAGLLAAILIAYVDASLRALADTVLERH